MFSSLNVFAMWYCDWRLTIYLSLSNLKMFQYKTHLDLKFLLARNFHYEKRLCTHFDHVINIEENKM